MAAAQPLLYTRVTNRQLQGIHPRKQKEQNPRNQTQTHQIPIYLFPQRDSELPPY